MPFKYWSTLLSYFFYRSPLTGTESSKAINKIDFCFDKACKKLKSFSYEKQTMKEISYLDSSFNNLT